MKRVLTWIWSQFRVLRLGQKLLIIAGVVICTVIGIVWIVLIATGPSKEQRDWVNQWASDPNQVKQALHEKFGDQQ